MGDYNIDLLTTTQHNNLRFINILRSTALYPHINKPTRISNTSQTLIDNIFSNAVAYLAYLVRGGKQRHRSIFRIGGGGVKVRKIPNFRRASRAKSQYLTFRAKRAAKMKIVYV